MIKKITTRIEFVPHRKLLIFRCTDLQVTLVYEQIAPEYHNHIKYMNTLFEQTEEL
jgi:hypothetical protein